MVIILFQLLIIISLFYLTNTFSLKENDELYLIHVEYNYNMSKFNINVLNREDAIINAYLSSRIAFMNNTASDDEIFNLYCNYINKYWIFLVNSKEVADQLLSRDDYDKNELYINGIMLPKSLKYKVTKNKNKNIPILEIDDNITDYFISHDIRNMDKNIYYIFDIKRAIANYPEIYLLIVALISLIIGLGMFTYWRYLMKTTARVNILSIHKIFYILPFFICLLSIALLIKSVDIKGQDPNKEYDGSVYIDTALITLGAIFRTLLWFLILLMCCGWKIAIQNLSREDLKFLMKMFLIIYISMCLDQIVDSASTGLWIFHLSEIKNFIFYVGMIILMLKSIKKTTLFLERRLYYARALSLEYVEALVFKVNFIKKFILMLFTYIGIYVSFMIIHKAIVYPYDTTLLELYDYSLVDLYLTCYFLYILKPKTLPPNYDIDFGNDIEGDIGLVYKAFLPNYKKINNDLKDLKQQYRKELLNCKSKEIPILILGPCVNHYNTNGEEFSINNYINNIEVGYIN